MSLKISQCSNLLPNNSVKNLANSRGVRCLEGRFTQRIVGLGRYIPNAHLRDTYLVMKERMSLEARTSFSSVRELAALRGVDMRTIRRHLSALAKLGVILVTRRKYACHSNYTNRYTFPLLNEDFLRTRLVSGGGDTNVRVKPLLEIKEQATTAAAGAAAKIHIPRTWKPDPERPKPSLEAELSRRRGREMRMQSRQERKLQQEIDASIGTRRYYEAQGYDYETQTPETMAWLERLGYTDGRELIVTDNGGER